ncbi:hypothetical protein I6A84_37115, partial [Frankia sp. CNm7]|nr:hypothetical protein [Frankia nepalensis]
GAAAPGGPARPVVTGAVAAATAGRSAVDAVRLARRLGAAPDPSRLAWLLVLAGRRYALEAAADNVRRGWWPLLAAGGPPPAAAGGPRPPGPPPPPPGGGAGG